MGENATYHNVVDHVGASLEIRSAIRNKCKNKGEIYNKNQQISIWRPLYNMDKGHDHEEIEFGLSN